MRRVSTGWSSYLKMSAHTDAPARADPMLASTMSFEMVQNKREEGYQLYGENSRSRYMVRVRVFSL